VSLGETKADWEVAIVGGGVGGLTLALALHHFGLKATVYEARPRLSEAGAGLWISANAMQVFKRLDLSQDIVDAGFEINTIDLRDYKSGTLKKLDLLPLREKYGHCIIAVKRATLCSLLADALERRSGTAVKFGHSCRSITVRDKKISILFGSYQGCNAITGAEVYTDVDTISVDCLVGADGLRSAVRGHLFPDCQSVYAGQSSWRKIVHGALDADLKRTSVEIWGKGKRFGFSQIAENEVYWYATVDAPSAVQPKHRLLALEGGPPRIFQDFPPVVQYLINSPPLEPEVHTDIFDLRPLPQWYQGPIVLLGDAAHATTPNMGQGAAQAVEDAYVLAQSLAQSHRRGGTLEQAFAQYQATRKRKADTVVRKSNTFGRMAHLKSGIWREFRNAVIRMTPNDVDMREIDHLYKLNF